jgi:anti-sigma B factor antagonist
MAEVLDLSVRPDIWFRLTVVDADPLRATIRAAGELDLAASGPLAELLAQQQIEGRRVISLDLSEVTFLDCSCLSVLVTAHHRLLERHGLLVLAEVDGCVARILRLTGLADRLFIAPIPERRSAPLAS